MRIKTLLLTIFCGASDESLLAECYKKLAFLPKKVIIFKDILSARRDLVDITNAIATARKKYAAYGAEMLAAYGWPNVMENLSAADDRYNLELTANLNS